MQSVISCNCFSYVHFSDFKRRFHSKHIKLVNLYRVSNEYALQNIFTTYQNNWVIIEFKYFQTEFRFMQGDKSYKENSQAKNPMNYVFFPVKQQCLG